MGDWIRGLVLGITNPVGTVGVFDVCLCSGYGGVCGEWVGDWTRLWNCGCGFHVCVSLSDYLCICQVQVSVYCARRNLCILGEPSVQPCCTLSISDSYRVFVYDRYRK